MNWHDRIRAARINRGFTARDRNDARSWTTCACGEQDAAIPRHWRGGPPTDRVLQSLGEGFYNAVSKHQYDRCEQLIDQIDYRASQILAEVFTKTED